MDTATVPGGTGPSTDSFWAVVERQRANMEMAGENCFSGVGQVISSTWKESLGQEKQAKAGGGKD